MFYPSGGAARMVALEDVPGPLLDAGGGTVVVRETGADLFIRDFDPPSELRVPSGELGHTVAVWRFGSVWWLGQCFLSGDDLDLHPLGKRGLDGVGVFEVCASPVVALASHRRSGGNRGSLAAKPAFRHLVFVFEEYLIEVVCASVTWEVVHDDDVPAGLQV